jgi:hypothetical protein
LPNTVLHKIGISRFFGVFAGVKVKVLNLIDHCFIVSETCQDRRGISYGASGVQLWGDYFIYSLTNQYGTDVKEGHTDFGGQHQIEQSLLVDLDLILSAGGSKIDFGLEVGYHSRRKWNVVEMRQKDKRADLTSNTTFWISQAPASTGGRGMCGHWGRHQCVCVRARFSRSPL